MKADQDKVVTIRRTRNADPQGSEVYIDGVKIPRPATVDWSIRPNDADVVTITFKGLVRVEFFDATNFKQHVATDQHDVHNVIEKRVPAES